MRPAKAARCTETEHAGRIVLFNDDATPWMRNPKPSYWPDAEVWPARREAPICPHLAIFQALYPDRSYEIWL
jgi:hypothetical protein